MEKKTTRSERSRNCQLIVRPLSREALLLGISFWHHFISGDRDCSPFLGLGKFHSFGATFGFSGEMRKCAISVYLSYQFGSSKYDVVIRQTGSETEEEKAC